MSDCDDDFTSINELPDEHSEEAALARRVKHKIMHDTDDDHDSSDDADDEMPQKVRGGRASASRSWYARIKGRFYDLLIIFVVIAILTWPSVQDVIEQFLGKSSTVFPVVAKAALGTMSYFLLREFFDQKKVF